MLNSWDYFFLITTLIINRDILFFVRPYCSNNLKLLYWPSKLFWKYVWGLSKCIFGLRKNFTYVRQYNLCIR